MKNEGKINVPKVKTVMGKKKIKKRPANFLGRGVVYLSHIPKGFYEDEMTSYFNQFGRVTRLNLVRSRSTGRPKGYAFIEFLYSEVAQVVAETMNNYLMFGRILKAKYIPGDQVRNGVFAMSKNLPDNSKLKKSRDKWMKKTNKFLSDEEVTEMATHELERLEKIKKEMQDSGIQYDCQVEGRPVLLLKNSDTSAEFDGFDSEVEQKVNHKVKQKNRKRSLSESSAASTPEKKRMSLLDGLKSKKDSPFQSPKMSPEKQDKTPVVKLKKMAKLTPKSAQKNNKTPLVSPKKEISSPKQSPKKVALVSPKKEISSPKQSSKKVALVSPKKEMSSPKQSPKKVATPKMSSSTKKTQSNKKTKETPTVKKQKSPAGSKKKQILGSAKKEKTPDSTKKNEKKSPLVISRRLAFSTSKKSQKSLITKKITPVKMRTP